MGKQSSAADIREDIELELEPVTKDNGEDATIDATDDELVVHREEEIDEERAQRRRRKVKTLFGLDPIVMVKTF
jgi:hypothetical protein